MGGNAGAAGEGRAAGGAVRIVGKESSMSTEQSRALDAQVAERVMGWKWYGMSPAFAELAGQDHPWVGRRALREDASNGVWTVEATLDMPVHDDFSTFPRYSTDMAAAWLVVEKLAAQGLRLSLDAFGGDPWWAEFADEKWERGAQATAPTAPEAICRAALAAMEGSK